jgi:hypothetical protein
VGLQIWQTSSESFEEFLPSSTRRHGGPGSSADEASAEEQLEYTLMATRNSGMMMRNSGVVVVAVAAAAAVVAVAAAVAVVAVAAAVAVVVVAAAVVAAAAAAAAAAVAAEIGKTLTASRQAERGYYSGERHHKYKVRLLSSLRYLTAMGELGAKGAALASGTGAGALEMQYNNATTKSDSSCNPSSRAGGRTYAMRPVVSSFFSSTGAIFLVSFSCFLSTRPTAFRSFFFALSAPADCFAFLGGISSEGLDAAFQKRTRGVKAFTPLEENQCGWPNPAKIYDAQFSKRREMFFAKRIRFPKQAAIQIFFWGKV